MYKYLKDYNINNIYNIFMNCNNIQRIKKEYNATEKEIKSIIKIMQDLDYKINDKSLSIYNKNGLIASYSSLSDAEQEKEYYKNNKIDIIVELANHLANNIYRFKTGYKVY